MNKKLVSIVKYEKPLESVRKAVDLCRGLDHLPSQAKVFIKPNIDIPSRKKCHNTHPEKNLNFWVSRLADKMPPMFTLIDGIYTAERGPNIDGQMHRSNLLVASADVLSADMVGAKVLGYEPAAVPHLWHAARRRLIKCIKPF